MHLLSQTVQLHLPQIIIGLAGGLALFLFGLEQLAGGLKTIAGEGLKNVLAKLTTNRFTALITGVLVTGAVQSSSVTTVLLVGFIGAGLMTMSQSIGVIIGANIGSTFTAQIIAFKVTGLALLMIAMGFAASFTPKLAGVRPWGRALMALGLVFLGMNLMGEAVAPMRAHQPFIDLMVMMSRPGPAILVAAAFTALVQSSAATLGVVIMLAGQGIITLEAGIALAFGANIGTCITAALASIGKPREAVRAALIHVLFNVAGVLLWLAFIDRLAALVHAISFDGAGDAATPREIANAHTVFNVVNAAVFIWFTAPMAWLVRKLVPRRPEKEPRTVRPKYLNEALLSAPALALETVRLELQRMGRRAERMLVEAPEAVLRGGDADLDRVAAMDDEVDILHGCIITYLGKLASQELSRRKSREVLRLMEAVNNIEHIGDTIETNLVTLGRQRVERGVTISDETQAVIEDIADGVLEAYRLALTAVAERDHDAATQATDMKPRINELVEAAQAHQARRLVAPEPNRLDLYTVEADVIVALKRIYYFARRMARTVRDRDERQGKAGRARGESELT